MKTVKTLKRSLKLIALLVSASFCLPASASRPHYSVTDLGTLGGSESFSAGVNDLGEVTGSAYVPGDASTHAFLYSGGIMIDLGTAGGTNSYGFAVNLSGEIVGWIQTATGNEHAFLYANGSMTDLGTLGGSNSSAYSINNSSQITGYSDTSGDAARWAFLYSGATMQPVVTNTTHSVGLDINMSGDLTGFAKFTSGYHAFRYSGGTIQDLGTFGGGRSIGRSVNDCGQIVGDADIVGGPYHAFLYSDGTKQDLGTLGGSYSQAYGINNSGQIVGISEIGPGGAHGFLYWEGNMYDLNDLVDQSAGVMDISLVGAGRAINNLGQIAAAGQVNGIRHAILLTPDTPPPPSNCLPTPTPTPTATFTIKYNQVVTTKGASNITSSSATLNGTVDPNAITTTVHFQYGTTTNYGSTTANRTYTGNTTQNVSANITGLSPNTTYHFRLVATNNGGTKYGSDRTFSTFSPTGPPVVATSAATNVASFSAALNGSVYPHGLTTSVYFQYGTTTGYGFTTAPQTKTGNTYQSVSANISGLSANTSYHFRIVTTNSAGTRYGSDRTFTTLPTTGFPVVTTNPATNLATSSATLHGSLDPHGLTTTVYLQYGTTTSYGHTTPTQSQTGNTFRNINADINGLSTHATYHFRIVATNTAGTRYGSDRTFTTQ